MIWDDPFSRLRSALAVVKKSISFPGDGPLYPAILLYAFGIVA